MIEIMVAKFLLKGAIKTLILKPAIAATMTFIPQSTFLHATFMGTNIGFTSSDLIKFGMERIYDKFGGKKLDFQIERLTDKIFRVVPLNPLAKLFFKEYNDEEELLVDLDIVGKYLDQLMDENMEEIESIEKLFERDEAVMQIIHDLDLGVQRSKPRLLGSREAESMLVEEILNKNRKLVRSQQKKKRKQRRMSGTLAGRVLRELPDTTKTPTTDTDEIDQILARIEATVTHKGKVPPGKKQIKMRDRTVSIPKTDSEEIDQLLGRMGNEVRKKKRTKI